MHWQNKRGINKTKECKAKMSLQPIQSFLNLHKCKEDEYLATKFIRLIKNK